MERTRLLLVDDHALFRDTLRDFLHSHSGCQVIGEAATTEDGLRLASADCPDLILLDITLPGGSGIGGLPAFRRQCPDTPVLIVTMHDDSAYLRSALAAGASGYVVKSSRSDVLLEAIRTVRRGELFIDPPMRSSMRESPAASPSGAPPVARLSDRERQVLQGLASGSSYRTIAERMGVSIKTVETYRTRLTRKLGFTSREDLVRFAIETGLLTPSES